MSNNITNSDILFGDHTQAVIPNPHNAREDSNSDKENMTINNNGYDAVSKTMLESFWQGQFGNDYTARNINLVENNYQMFKNIFYYSDDNEEEGGCLKREFMHNVKSIIEFGAGSGMNIQALQRIFPDARYRAIEINESACDYLMELENVIVHRGESILNMAGFITCDLVLSKGLLIHIHSDNIQKAYEVLYNTSNKYILLCEYYSPERREIVYRGEHNKLWAFDFMGEMKTKYPDLKTIDYGFISKYDQYPQDDLTYILFSK